MIHEAEVEPLLLPSLGSGGRMSSLSLPHQLSVIFAVVCIVDQFNILPVITLPRTIILCGWIGFPLAITVFGISIYTAILLGRCWVIAESIDHTMVSKTRYPYTALVTLAWGKHAGCLLNWYLNIAVFTSNIPALVIASQNLQSLNTRLSGYWYNLSYCYWLIILGLFSCPFTWLGSPKDLKWLSVVSTSCVVISSVLTWICMIWDDSKSFTYRDVPPFNWQSIAIAYGNLAFQLACHPAILSIQADMKDKSQLSHSVICSFFVTGGLFLTTSLLALVLYGGGVKANLTEGLPSNMALFLDIALITLQLFLSTIVGGCALWLDVEEKLGISGDTICWQRCVLRTLIVMAMVFLAEVLPRFDLVMGLFGGLFTGPLTFVLPPLLYYKFRAMLPEPVFKKPQRPTTQDVFSGWRARISEFVQHHFFSLDTNLNDGGLTAAEKTLAVVIIVFGLIATVLAIYFSLRGAVWSSQFVPPCLFNVEAASRIVR